MALTKVGKDGITGVSNASDATAITIDSSENVGIGTSSPNSKLTSQTASTSTSAFSFATQLNNSSGAMGQPNDGIVALGFHNRADVNATGVGAAIAMLGGSTSGGSGNLIFCIKDATDIANVVDPADEKMRIDNNGIMTVLSEGRAVTTSVQQGLAKAWVNHPGTATAGDSFNMTSITDNGTGDYTYTIANDFRAATVYCAAGMCRSVGSGAFLHSSKQGDAVNKNAGTMRIYTGNSAGTAADSGDVDTIFHGDLA